MSIAARFTIRDLERLPDVEGIRYEIIDGELYVSKAPGWEHQFTSVKVCQAVQNWSDQSGLGVTLTTPGLVFAEDEDVIPDIVWISLERLAAIVDHAGHLTAAPELVIEVVSPGRENERRDRQIKLELYARRDAGEYWIVDWRRSTVDVYRRMADGLQFVATLADAAVLTSPLLPGFSCPLVDLWPPLLARR